MYLVVRSPMPEAYFALSETSTDFYRYNERRARTLTDCADLHTPRAEAHRILCRTSLACAIITQQTHSPLIPLLPALNIKSRIRSALLRYESADLTAAQRREHLLPQRPWFFNRGTSRSTPMPRTEPRLLMA